MVQPDLGMNMNKRRLPKIAWLFFSAVICVLAGLWFLAVRPLDTVARLSDGTELHLLDVTVGTNQFSVDSVWQRVARRVLPLRYSAGIPRAITASYGWTNSITVWLQLRDPIHRTNLHQYWNRMETVSDSGETQRAEGGSGGSYDPAARFHGYALQNFPRRQGHFLLRFYGTNQLLLGSLRVPNPWRGPFAEWTPDPQPVTKTNGDLAVTFSGITKLLEEFPPGKTSSFYRADFKFQQNGVPTTNWSPAWCWLDDPTGNSIGAMMPGVSERERVWRLRQRFYRKEDSRFSPEEHIVITNLTIPAPGNFVDISLFTNLQGIALGIFTWSGAAALTLSNGVIIDATAPEKQESDWSQLWSRVSAGSLVRRLNFGRPALFVAHQPDPDHDVRFVFRDEHGKRVDVMNPSPGSFLSDYLWARQSISEQTNLPPGLSPFSARILGQAGWVLQPEIPLGVKSLSLEVIVQRLPGLEFFVEPPKRVKWIGWNADERNRQIK